MLSRTARKCLTLIKEMEFNPKVYFQKNIGYIETCIKMELESNTHRVNSILKTRAKK